MWYRFAETEDWIDELPEGDYPQHIQDMINSKKFRMKAAPTNIGMGEGYKIVFSPHHNNFPTKKSKWGEEYIVHPDLPVDMDEYPQIKDKENYPNTTEQVWGEHDRYKVRENPQYIYRGMSSREYQNIIKNGYIETDNSHNLSNQFGTTLFSVSPSQALNYASSFAVEDHRPTFDEPGYVIKLKIPENAIHANGVNVVGDEIAVPGRIPIDAIEEIIEVNPYAMQPYTSFIIQDRQNPSKYHSHGGEGGNAGYYLKKIEKPSLGAEYEEN